jgi:hypothetical protein
VRPRRLSASFVALIVLALAVAAVGCPCLRGPVNSSESLRWWLFSHFGASKVCPEMLKRGVPLKMAALGPNSIGRFFPEQCQVAVNDAEHTMMVSVAGTGYASLTLTRRIGFAAAVKAEYRPDFRLEEDATYVWGRFNRLLEPPTLQILGVENSLVSLATKLPFGGDLATNLGQSVITSEIGRGFTVVRTDDGDFFALGMLTPPERPPVPLPTGSDHTVLGTDVSEVRAQARDYLGPFTVAGDKQALFIKLRVANAPVTVYLVDRSTGDLWRKAYQSAQPLAPPPGNAIATGAGPIGDTQQIAPLPPGQYYLVVENVAPVPQVPFGLPIPAPEIISFVTYSVELGERP